MAIFGAVHAEDRQGQFGSSPFCVDQLWGARGVVGSGVCSDENDWHVSGCRAASLVLAARIPDAVSLQTGAATPTAREDGPAREALCQS